MRQWVSIFVLVLGVMLPARALAQQAPPTAGTLRPERPYRGVFGGGAEPADHGLSVSADFGAAFYQRLRAADTLFLTTPDDTWAGFGSGGLTYSLNRSLVGISAWASSAARYLPARDKRPEFRHAADLNGTLRLPFTARTQATVQESLRYQPQFLAGFSDFEASTIDSQVFRATVSSAARYYLTSETRATLTHRLSGRSVLAAGYSFRSEATSGSDLDARIQDAGLRLTVGMTPHFSLLLGYRFTESRRGSGDTATRSNNHSVEAGLGYGRALSLSRRTSLGFGSGVSSATDSGGTTQTRLVGHVEVIHEIGRTWNASARYSHDLGFLDLVQEPTETDNLTAYLQGLISRRVSAYAGVIGTQGRAGFTGDGTGIRSATALASLGVATSRYLGVSVAYSYYHRDYQAGVAVVPGLVRQSATQSIQAFGTLWVPLFPRTRRPNASR